MKKTICLNMIVKNESHIVTRSLASVKDLIDYWVIVDTGSTDGTQTVIKEFLKEIPGELHERPWVDFGYNRQEAKQLATGKADYLLFIDADDRLVFSENFSLPHPLDKDIYSIVQRESYQDTFREHKIVFLLRNSDEFEWRGVLHESVNSKTGFASIELITGVFNEYINDGSRSKDPDKIKKDIQILKKGIRNEPENPRYPFYLARTFWSVKDYKQALSYFKKRSKMGGDPMEVYHSLLYIGLAQKKLNYDHQVFIKSCCQAFLYRPTRTESLYELARYYADTQQYLLGYLISKFIVSIPLPEDNLFVESWVYDWGAMLYLFICSSRLGNKEEAYHILQRLLENPRLPINIRKDFQLDQWGDFLSKESISL